MPRWKEFEQAEAEFAARVRALFDAGRHKTIATLRADGSPRISGIECEFADGDLRFGSMSGARKGEDLERDPRFALHGPTFHPVEGKVVFKDGSPLPGGLVVFSPVDPGGKSGAPRGFIHGLPGTCPWHTAWMHLLARQDRGMGGPIHEQPATAGAEPDRLLRE